MQWREVGMLTSGVPAVRDTLAWRRCRDSCLPWILGSAMGLGCQLYDEGLLNRRGDNTDAAAVDADDALRDAGGVSARGGRGGPQTDGSSLPGSSGSGGDSDPGQEPAGDCSNPQSGSPEVCGCGSPDRGGDADCEALRETLLNRYRFTGEGTQVEDVISGADGIVVNALLDGQGGLPLGGGTADAYMALPTRMVSALTDATIELWLTWSGGEIEQSVFGFGSAIPPAAGAGCAGIDPVYGDGAYYHFCLGPLDWEAANASCGQANGTLTAIETEDEQSNLAVQLPPGSFYWIGANDRQAEGTWRWVTLDGTDGAPFWTAAGAVPGVHTGWSPGQPNNNGPNADANGEDCGVIDELGQWWDFGCGTASAFICESQGQPGDAIHSALRFTVAGPDGATATLSFAAPGEDEVRVQAAEPLPAGTPVHVTAVLAESGGAMSLYIDGRLSAATPFSASLGVLRDIDNWIGRSLLAAGAPFSGTIHELRIYAAALTAEQIAASYWTGPDATF